MITTWPSTHQWAVIPLKISGGAEEQRDLGGTQALLTAPQNEDGIQRWSSPCILTAQWSPRWWLTDPTGNVSLVSLSLSTPAALIMIQESQGLFSAALWLFPLPWAASPPNFLILTLRFRVLVPETTTQWSAASARPRVWTSGPNPGSGYGRKGWGRLW